MILSSDNPLHRGVIVMNNGKKVRFLMTFNTVTKVGVQLVWNEKLQKLEKDENFQLKKRKIWLPNAKVIWNGVQQGAVE